MVVMKLLFHWLQDDPTTCGIILSEKQYEAVLRNPEQHPIWSKKAILPSCADGVHGSVDPILEFKEDFIKLKAKLDGAVNDISKLKLQVEILKKDYVIIAAVCVGVVIGCILSTIWK